MPPLIPLRPAPFRPAHRVAHILRASRTDAASQTDSQKKKVTWTITKWTEDGKEIEKVEMIEEMI